jgi:hypothetical protein
MRTILKTKKSKSVMVLGALLTGLFLGGVVSVDAAPSSITVCSLKTTGNLRYSKSGVCKATETKLSLGEIGPTGPAGSFTGTSKVSVLSVDKTLAMEDLGSTLVVAKTVKITVPTDSSVAFPIGTIFNVAQTAGQTFVSGAVGVTVNGVISTGSQSLAAFDSGEYQYGVLVKVAANSWALLTQAANK